MENKKNTYLSGIAVLLVLILYVWFISIGPWRSRGYTSDYYSRMAASFRHGQLALEEKPDPSLLALPNPYNQKTRKNVPIVRDASLYEGKYYLYFGPVPSIPLAGIIDLLPTKPGDQVFLYLFIFGLFSFACLLFREIVQSFFKDIPVWMLPLGILVLGLTGPFLRMLAHPFIHEAAIAGGQLFFIAGFYAAFRSFEKRPIQPGKLLLAGIFWSCAVATRNTLLVPVAFISVLTWLYILHEYRKTGTQRQLVDQTLALATPLIVCGIGLAWYNWARFDSIFEFGLYYQLAAFNLQANYSILFSRIYLIQNIFNYFLNPFKLSGSFPFVVPVAGSEKSIISSITLPNLYAVEGRFSGAIWSTPFLLFSVLPVLMLAWKYIKALGSVRQRNDLFNFFDWTVLGLLGSFIAGAIPILLLFYVGIRYEADFITSLTLLALIGFCQGYSYLRTSRARKLYALAGILLAIFSMAANIALSYGGITG